jgi:hypothetical protein
MFGMHGLGGYAMELGNRGQELTLNDYKELSSQNLKNYLKQGGDIVLWSCSAGKEEKTEIIYLI